MVNLLKKSSIKGLHMNANIAWGLIGKLIYAASRGGLLIMLAKLGNAEMVGQFALAFAITTPVFMLADLNLRTVYATDVMDAFDYKDYKGLRAATTAIALLVITVIALLQSDMRLSLIIMLVALARGFESMSDIAFGLYQRQQRMDRLGRSMILKGVLSVVLMGSLLWLSRNLLLAVAGLAAAWIMVYWIYDYQNLRHENKHRMRFKLLHLWKLTKKSLPLGVVLLIISLNTNVINYMIKGMIGVEALGYYASIIYLMIVGSTFVSTLGQATTTKLAQLYKQDNIRGFVKLMMKLLSMVLCIGLMAVGLSAVAGKPILTLLYDASYGAYKDIMILVMIGAAAMHLSDMLNYAVTAIQKFKIQPIMYGVVLVLGAACNFLFMTKWGLKGAAFGLIAVYCMQLLANGLVLVFALRKKGSKMHVCEQNGIVISKISSMKELDEKTEEAWVKILNDNEVDYVFCYPGFIKAWETVYSNKYKPLILVAKHQGMVVGICPLCYEHNALGYMVYYAGYPHATHTDAVIGQGYEKRVMLEVLKTLDVTFGHYCLDWKGLKEDSQALQTLHIKAISSHTLCAVEEHVLPVVDIKAKKMDAFYKDTFSSHARKRERQRMKRLNFLGDVSFKQLSHHDMDRIFALHERRWEKKCDTSGFTDVSGRKLFKQLVKQGLAQIYALCVDEHIMSFEYAFICRDRCMLFRSSHDEKFDAYAAGLIVDRYMIEHCCNKGLGIVDFGVGYEPYKMRWKPNMQKSMSILMAGKSLRSVCLYRIKNGMRRLKGLAKKSRKIILFRRNTLGNIRYILSLTHVAKLWSQFAVRFKLHGLKVLTAKFGKPKYLCLDRTKHNHAYVSPWVHELNLAQVEELADLMLCRVEGIMRRLYTRHQCFVLEKQNKILCCAWVHQQDLPIHAIQGMGDQKRGHAIYEIAYRGDVRQEEIAELIDHVCHELQPSGQGKIYMRVDKRDSLLMVAHQVLGFDVVDHQDDEHTNDLKGRSLCK